VNNNIILRGTELRCQCWGFSECRHQALLAALSPSRARLVRCSTNASAMGRVARDRLREQSLFAPARPLSAARCAGREARLSLSPLFDLGAKLPQKDTVFGFDG
jgi:hypothetical protein